MQGRVITAGNRAVRSDPHIRQVQGSMLYRLRGKIQLYHYSISQTTGRLLMAGNEGWNYGISHMSGKTLPFSTLHSMAHATQQMPRQNPGVCAAYAQPVDSAQTHSRHGGRGLVRVAGTRTWLPQRYSGEACGGEGFQASPPSPDTTISSRRHGRRRIRAHLTSWLGLPRIHSLHIHSPAEPATCESAHALLAA